MTTHALVAEHNRLMDLSLQCTGGGTWKMSCSCDQEHVICVFTAGSLYCVRSNCSNPHHRREM